MADPAEKTPVVAFVRRPYNPYAKGTVVRYLDEQKRMHQGIIGPERTTTHVSIELDDGGFQDAVPLEDIVLFDPPPEPTGGGAHPDPESAVRRLLRLVGQFVVSLASVVLPSVDLTLSDSSESSDDEVEEVAGPSAGPSAPVVIDLLSDDE